MPSECLVQEPADVKCPCALKLSTAQFNEALSRIKGVEWSRNALDQHCLSSRLFDSWYCRSHVYMAQAQDGHVLEDRQHADRMTQRTEGVYRFYSKRSGCTRVYPELTVKRCELVTGKIPALTLVACPNEYIYKPNDCYVWSCLFTDLDSSVESTFWREGRVKTLNNHERHLSEGRGNFLYPRKNSSSGKVNAPQSHTIC